MFRRSTARLGALSRTDRVTKPVDRKLLNDISQPSEEADKPKGKKRVVDKDKHRIELLDATAWVVAKYGISGTTIDRIQEHSGLSRGMINLHFKTKHNLFVELLKYKHETYETNWKTALSQAPDAPRERLAALIASDFSPKVMNRIDGAVWVAFRAEAVPQKEYRPYTTTRDDDFMKEVETCCRQLADEGEHDVDPKMVTVALTNILEGMLLDFHLHHKIFDRDHGIEVCMSMVNAYFPVAFE